MICKDCKQDIPKFWTGRRDKSGEKVYVDDNDRRWHRGRCCSCYSEYHRIQSGKPTKKTDGLGLLGPEIDVNPLTTRKCRRCGDLLPASNYFWHSSCHPFYDINNPTSYDASDWGYAYVG